MQSGYRIIKEWSMYNEETNKGWNLEDIRIKDPEVDLGTVYKIAMFNKTKNIHSIVTIEKKYVVKNDINN